ncbi:MAG: DUF1343 domain-containing protein [Muribaculaceae bacterium]|nr:DUF1343 domain-containing protein [Muribaculaceae bacterium]MEE1298137.1 DUF1343 domain-containing protein [Muribaculaceae bacterium]
MKKLSIFLSLVCLVSFLGMAQVKPGIETLRDGGFEQLKGKRVGLITNPSGVDNNLKSTIDILSEAEGVKLTALYSPEHGVRGDIYAGAKVDTYVDKKTGVTVFSLYGKNKKPSAEMLKDVDVLIYDIQDNGCRSFTFISTMGLCMEACAENNKEFMVLDRPNPLSGLKVEGCLVEDGFYSLVSQFPIPYLYGLTPGELALMLNDGMLKDGKKAKLTVVPMTGWHRYMTFDQTGMPWILPSPHQPYPQSAVYYPTTGIIGELYNISIGVGYTMPFQLICAPWIEADKFCDRMNGLNLKGIVFRPIHIKPYYSQSKGENIQGVQLYVTDVLDADLTMVQFHAMEVLAEMYPEKRLLDEDGQGTLGNRWNMFDKVCGTNKIRIEFSKNYKVADIIEYWNKDVDAFREKSKKYYLYN